MSPPEKEARFATSDVTGRSLSSSACNPIPSPSRRSPEMARRDFFREQYLAIIKEAQTLILAVQDLSAEPLSATRCARLKVAGRELKRRCNRLAYNVLRKAGNS